MSDMREQQVLNQFKEDEVVYVSGSIDWELLDDGREPPVDMPTQIALSVQVNGDGTVYDIIDQDMG